MNGRDLWLQCVEWLVAVGALPRHHRTCDRNATVFELAQTLRDGVVLCNVLNILAPGAIDESSINFRAQLSEFLCKQNIRIAIFALRTYFKIPPSENFTVDDLYDLNNFPKVLQTLSYLSCLPESASKYPPFQPSRRQSTRQRSSFDGEDIYSNLPELASEHSLADEDVELYASVPDEKEEGIYGSLIGVQKRASALLSPKTDKRECCIHEIVETENNYVFTLELMIKQYMQPLQGTMNDEDIGTIFSNVEQLYPIHREFCDELVRLQQSTQTAKFSEPFKIFMEKFLFYGQYCSHMADAQDLLDDAMKKSDKVRLKVEECQQRSSRPKFKLRDMLCVPLQRVLKYHLLVMELHKHTLDSHTDKASLAEAVRLMQELSMYINEVKRDSEELIKINKIEASLDEYKGIPMRLYGRVQRDGELKVKFGDKNLSTRNVFLFDKALIMTKLRNDSYILKDLVRLEDMQLDEMPSQKQNKAKWSSCLKLFSLKQTASYLLYCKTVSEKDKWAEAFKKSFDNISPQALKGKKHSFTMQTFPEPTHCDSCKSLLKGIFYQGYECSVTNARCHRHCLADTLKLIENNSIGTSTSARNKDKVPPVPDRGRKKRLNPPLQDSGVPVTVGTLSYKAHRAYNGLPAPPFPNATCITFQIGQPIEVLEQVTPDWWKGKSYDEFDKIGFFPSSHVSPRKPHARINGQTHPEEEQFDKPKPCPSSPEQLRNYYWYAGEIDRAKAEQLLWDTPSGTFLVRKKDHQGLVISLKFLKDVKHIRILQTADNMHYVAECKNFRSVQELVSFYQINSLSGFFLGLETTLKLSYRDPVLFPGRADPSPTIPMRLNMSHSIQQTTRRSQDGCNGGTIVAANGRTYGIAGVAKAKFDFEARSEQELSLRAGELVNIISKAGEAHGWWKGELNGQIGYFPTTFVEE